MVDRSSAVTHSADRKTATDYILAKVRDDLQRGIKVSPGLVANLLADLDYERRPDVRTVMAFEAGIAHLAGQMKEYIDARMMEDAPALRTETHDALMDLRRIVQEETA